MKIKILITIVTFRFGCVKVAVIADTGFAINESLMEPLQPGGKLARVWWALETGGFGFKS